MCNCCELKEAALQVLAMLRAAPDVGELNVTAAAGILSSAINPVAEEVPWDRDLRGELATNPHCPPPLDNGWWKRDLSQIDGVTLHHTLSNSPHATARYYVAKGGGRPSIPYTIWISETGETFLCNDLEAGCWHDHTGHCNTHLSVGLAGTLHIHQPSNRQLTAAARVCAWAVNHLEMNVTRESVKGHDAYFQTQCPGWHYAGWRDRFYALMDGMLK